MKRIVSFLLVFVLVASVLISAVRAEDYTPNTESGWVEIDDERYYLKEDGTYQTGWDLINGNWYYFNDKGAMQTGWLKLGDNSYYLNYNGTMKTGWLDLDGDRYYFSDSGAMVKGWLVIDGKKYLFDNSGKCVEGAHTFVIDISKWQGTIDWDKLKETDIDAVILRISHGDLKDTRFVEYIENLERLKIPYGIYHFNTATTVEIARIQAQNVVGILKETGAKPTFPVFADIETNGGKCDLIKIAKVYMETFIENGYMPGIYANQNYWKNYLNDPELCVYYRWIANYGVNNGYPNEAFSPDDGIENYMMWQYTSVGQIDGITENTVDLNALFDWYKKPDGLVEINGKKFLYSNGYIKYGWFCENESFTYFKPSGEMAVGWSLIDNKWYYFNSDGIMQTGWLLLNGNWYYLNENGAMHTGWLSLDGEYYYFNDNGIMQTGWLELDEGRYYLSDNGEMVKGWAVIDGQQYFFDDSGKCEDGAYQTGWCKINETWYYFNENGVMQTGWLSLGDTCYYLDDSGVMKTGWLKLNDNWYYFDDNGAMQTGWLKLGDNSYYLNYNGAMQTGWLDLDGDRYYFSDSGAMVKGWLVIDGKKYLFDNSGKCVEGAHTFVIDISKYQGTIDWDKLKETDIDAVILRISHGDLKDTRFVEYIENLERLKIPYGIYHFNTATTVEIAKIQAQNVVDALKETGAEPTYPVFADIETNGGECDLIKIAKVYMETFIENGYMPGVYANQNYWKNYLNDPELCVYYRWIANYGVNNGYPNEAFSPDDGIENYMMWQYTSVGQIDGITENTVDLNALFDWYKKPDGTVEINGKKFIYSDGYFKYGWFCENESITYFKPSGEMAVGWLNLDDCWYYFNEEGIMQTGWSYISNNWYYLNSNGTMHIGWLKLDNTWYYLNENGTMKTGWLKSNNTWYYLNDYGAMHTGWLRLGGNWYYLNDGGAMVTGWLNIGGVWYYLNDNGTMKTGWLKLNDTWYYLNDYGAMQTGWLKLGKNWYYLSDGGPMVTGWLYLNNTWYYFEQSGAWRN